MLTTKLEIIATHLTDYHADESGDWTATLLEAAARIRKLEKVEEVLLERIRELEKVKEVLLEHARNWMVCSCRAPSDWVVKEEDPVTEGGVVLAWYCGSCIPEEEREAAVRLRSE